jgi:predicted nucleic acid-binding protein
VKALLDLNILLDVVQKRKPHFAASSNVLAMAVRGEFEALVPSHFLTTLHYVVARHADARQADLAVDWVLAKLKVCPTAHTDFFRARALAIDDFEDAVVAATAESSGCKYVVTRNVADFVKSPVPALTPEEFVALRRPSGI